MYFRVLGTLEIEHRGELLLLRGVKQRALLAILLLHANEAVSRDVLIDDLWGEHGPPNSVHSLQAHVSRLRKVLRTHDGQPLVTEPTGYRLNVGVDECDLLCFERLLEDGRRALRSGGPDRAARTLREALSLWRGRAFEDVAYEAFAQVEIERLEERRLEALEERIDADLALGHQADLVAEIEALVRKRPLHERLRRQLMIALYRSGRQAEALSAYHEARRELVEQLGIEPSRPLQELQRAILRQDPALEAAPAPPHDDVSIRRRLVGRRPALMIALVLSGLGAVVAGIVVHVFSGREEGISVLAPNSVGVIDTHSAKISGEIPVGGRPTALAADGGLWVANFDSGTLSHLNTATRKVVSVTNAGGTPTGLATGAGSVWVSNGFAGRVLRVNERTGRVTATIPIKGHPDAITVDQNAVWVANPVEDTVARIDPNSLQVMNIRVGGGPSGLAAGAGSIWVANGLEGTLTRIDSASGAVVRRRIALRFAPMDVAFGDGSVWVTGTAADALARVNPTTDRSFATVRVGDGPTQVLLFNHRVWVANAFGRTLSEVDPTRNSVVHTIGIGESPEGLASSAGQLWVAAHAM